MDSLGSFDRDVNPQNVTLGREEFLNYRKLGEENSGNVVPLLEH